MKTLLLTLAVSACCQLVVAQLNSSNDTLKAKNFNEVLIKGIFPDLIRMNPIDGLRIMSGKKNEVILIQGLNADLSTNNYRQILAKVPGVSIWESDGSGIQTSIATRGLSPNRSWEFNVRMNGCDISSDAYGYPEAYFTPPTEALDRLEIIRGAASLQYGTQFGGLINYVTKKSLGNQPITFESQQTIGSYGLFNSYNGIGGKIKKFSYYGYLHHRSADGWRDNSQYRTTSGHVSLSYAFTSKFNATFEYTHMDYLSQQPGGLTDSMFNSDAQQSVRARNWFSSPWNGSALHLEYTFNENSKMKLSVFNTYAQRNSVGYLKDINLPDSLSGNYYNNRQVDRDFYNNWGAELRHLTTYSLFGKKSVFSTGVRAYFGKTNRKQGGIGSLNSDFDLTITEQSTSVLGTFDYKKELHLSTAAGALFAENLFQITSKLAVTPGIRMEYINNAVHGAIDKPTIGATIDLPETKRVVLLAGAGAEYTINQNMNVYSNFSQAFRPVTYAELTPAATTDSVDQNLKDAKGYNFDLGYRGSVGKYLTFDVGAFYLFYDNRIGTILENGKNYKTNIGASISKGIEAFAELDVFEISGISSSIGNLKVFANIAFVDARYTRWDDPAALLDLTKDFAGNYVENAPRNINRFGIQYKFKRVTANVQYNQVGEVYTDAHNTELPISKSTVGKLAGYQVIDASCTYLINGKYNIKLGVNNLTNAKYATRRSGGYPGPGILPANGRTFFFSIGLKI